MQTFQLELDDQVVKDLSEAAAVLGMDVHTFIMDMVISYARRRAFDREWDQKQALPRTPEEHAEEQELAEWGMAEYAARLAQEDKA